MQQPQNKTRKKRWTQAWDYGVFAYKTLVAPYPPFLAVIGLGALVGALTPLVQVSATHSLIDGLMQSPQAPAQMPVLEVLAPYWGWLGLVVVAMFLNWMIYNGSFQDYLAAQVNARIQLGVERQVLQKAMGVELEHFERPAYYQNLQRAQQALAPDRIGRLVDALQRSIAQACGCVGLLWFFAEAHWGIALLLGAGSLPLIGWRIRSDREMINIGFQQTEAQRRRDYWRDLLVEQQPAAEVRLFGLAAHFISRWRGLTDQLLQQVKKARWRNMRGGAAITAADLGLSGLIILGLIWAAAAGRLSAGSFVALVYALPQYLGLVFMISLRLEDLHRFFGEYRYVQGFLHLQGDEPQGGKAVGRYWHQGIRLEGVGFTYPGQATAALADIDLHIRPGERLALVGENGAGKTTLIKLLLGLYRPTQGRIAVDGVDLRQIQPEAWRRVTSAVLQDFGRYAFSVRENIGFGQIEELDDEAAIVAAAKRSGADAMIEALPQGYDTRLGRLGDRAQELSMGQWQKIALARAYLRDAGLLVLDEPASALDALAELEVYRQFMELAQDRAVLLVSHRLGSARLADRILFMRQGRIVEIGNHQQLVAADGAYAELYRLQAVWYGDEGAKE